MCGIWGYFNCRKESVKYSEIVNKFFQIQQRGPDTSSIMTIKKNNYIGFHRLSIMDKSHKADQPFITKTKERQVFTMVNGEIYNYRMLLEKYNLVPESKSDCEVIHLLYLNCGLKDVLQYIEGEFAIAIIDVNNATNVTNIILCRDRFGIKPLYYCINKEICAFSSELKGLTKLPDVNDNNILQFPARTFLKHTIGTNLSSYNFYYKVGQQKLLPCTINSEDPIKEILQNIQNIFTESVKKMIRSDRPIGALLSGGLDSSLVVSIASRYLASDNKKLNTFSIGMPGSTDHHYAQLVADHCNTNHKHIELSTEDFLNAVDEVIKTIETYDITTVRASVGQYLIAKWINENTDIKVLLCGDGSDELTSGYMYFHNAPNPKKAHKENIRLLNNIHYFDVLRADRCVADNGLETRVPFLDHKFVDYYLSIDPQLRVPVKTKFGDNKYVNRSMEKWLLREAFNLTEESYLPESVLWRRKEAFSDGISSVQHSWHDILKNRLKEKYDKNALDNISYTYNIPTTCESLYYREQYMEYFGDTAHIMPYFWMPQWCDNNDNINDPSARVLKVYK